MTAEHFILFINVPRSFLGKFAYLLDSGGWLDIAAFAAAQRGHPLGQPVSSITE
jgi:hypothetical protein